MSVSGPQPGPYDPNAGAAVQPSPAHGGFISGPPADAVGNYPPAPMAAAPVGAPAPLRRPLDHLGWIGVLALYVLIVVQFLIPTIRNFSLSTTDASMMGEGQDVGLGNYAAILPELFPGLLYSFAAVALAALLSAALGLVIASAMSTRASLAVPARIGVGVLGVLFTPVALGATGVDAAFRQGGGVGEGTAALLLIGLFGLAWVPLLTACYATAFSAALSSGRDRGLFVALVCGAGFFGALAGSLQAFSFYFAVRFPGTEPPAAQMFTTALQMAATGRAAAYAVVMFVVAAVGGVLVMLWTLALRPRLVVSQAQPSRAGITGLVVLIVAVVVAIVSLVPVFGAGADDSRALSPAVDLWLAAALGALLQLAVAAAIGVSIGWFQPAGRHSLWLLVPLAPWLLSAPAQFMITTFEWMGSNGQLQDSIVMPSPLAPVLVVLLAIAAAGLRDQRNAGVKPPLRVVLGGLGLAWAVLVMVHSQSLLPSVLTQSSPIMSLLTATIALNSTAGLALLLPAPVILVVGAIAAVSQLGIRRLAFERDGGPLPSAAPPVSELRYPDVT